MLDTVSSFPFQYLFKMCDLNAHIMVGKGQFRRHVISRQLIGHILV